MREPKSARQDAPQTPICNLNVALPETITPEMGPADVDAEAIESKYSFLREAGYGTKEPLSFQSCQFLKK
jgi:ankyrin